MLGRLDRHETKLHEHGQLLSKHDERDNILESSLGSLDSKMDAGFAKLDSSSAVVRDDVKVILGAHPNL